MHANDQAQTSEGKKPACSASKALSRGGGVPAGLLALQSTAGNAAAVQMLRQAGHPWAQEQHQHGAGCGHQQAGEQPAVQRSAVHDVLRSGGRPLDNATRTDMEARLGADFSDVRIHNDSAAKASATEVGARAYTSGNHVVIGDGGADKHTLAHELTHVIQQRQGPVAGTDNGAGLRVSDPSDRFEREAEDNATRVMARSVRVGSHIPGPGTEQRTTGATDSVQRVHYPPGEVVTANPGFSVILNAALNGIHIGTFTSENQFAAVTQDHAEDQLIDELTAAIEWARMGHPQMAVQGAGAQVIPALEAGIQQGRTVHNLQIDLSASPCSTAFGTSTKINGVGCAERLVELTQLRFGNEDQYSLAINVRAHHLYQPRHIQNPAQVSTQVNQWMASLGVPVRIG